MRDRETPAGWKRLIGTLAAVFLGLVLLLAAWGKALDPEAFVEQIEVEGLAFFGQPELVAYFALILEVALGMALVLGVRRKWVLIPSLLLVLFFLFLTGRTYWRFEQGLITESDSCGCFGNLVTRTPAQAFWQDLFLLGVPMLLSLVGLPPGQRKFPSRRIAAVIVVSIAALWLSIRSPELPLDDWATRLRPGVEIATLCAGSENSPGRICLDALVTDLETGSHWVIISNLDEEEFLEAMPDLNGLSINGEVGVWVLTAAVPEDVSAFEWTQAPAFSVREAPKELLRPLRRRLPRSFRVDSGTIVETVSGLPPAAK